MNFLQNIAFTNQFIIIKKNLHQSRAGIGNKLKTQRFILITAVIISKNIIHSHIDLLMKSTIHIGQLIDCIAVSLSFSSFGANILFHNFFKA